MCGATQKYGNERTRYESPVVVITWGSKQIKERIVCTKKKSTNVLVLIFPKDIIHLPDFSRPRAQVIAKFQVSVDQVERDEIPVAVCALAIVEDHPVGFGSEELHLERDSGRSTQSGQLDEGVSIEAWNERDRWLWNYFYGK